LRGLPHMLLIIFIISEMAAHRSGWLRKHQGQKAGFFDECRIQG
jgi:hypothetical protein